MTRHRYPVVVHVLLLRDDRLFLLRRAGTGFLDGWHVPPGGHQQGCESVSEAARRECREEAGVVPAILEPVCVLAYGTAGGDAGEPDRGLNFVFEAGEWQGEPGNAEPACCDAAGWYALADLPAPHAAWLDEALRLRREPTWFVETP